MAAAFVYDPIADPITSAAFYVDVAALVAHRYVSGSEVNYAKLIDSGGSLGQYDLSDDLFGTAAFPDTPQLDMGLLETAVLSVDIDSSFFPALTDGHVSLDLMMTDTDDAMFAIDFISLTIVTNIETVESYYGGFVGNENNGFGIGLADGGDLPAPLPDSIPGGSTGTGFDETISCYPPEPASFALLAVGALALRKKR